MRLRPRQKRNDQASVQATTQSLAAGFVQHLYQKTLDMCIVDMILSIHTVAITESRQGWRVRTRVIDNLRVLVIECSYEATVSRSIMPHIATYDYA